MSEEKSQVDILDGEPVTIRLFGKDLQVRRMPFSKQRQAVGMISEVYTDASSKGSHMERMFDLAVKILPLAIPDIDPKEFQSEKMNLMELLRAFRAVWKQNGFDFLSDTVADLTTTKTTGE